MQNIIDVIKELGPLFAVLWAAVILLSVWRPQRYLNSILLMAACMFTLIFISAFFGENAPKALIVCAGLIMLALLLVPVMLIINGIHMRKRESRSLGNTLSLILGIVIAAGEIAAFFFFLGVAGLLDTVQFNTGLLFVFLTVFYFSCLILSFVVYCVFIQILPHRNNFDFIIIHGCSLADGERLTKLLQSRVDKAIQVFEKCGRKPVIIPSGGQGSDEKISEAQAMKNYLLERGIPEESIVTEDRSATTRENLLNSMNIIKEYPGKRKTALVSSNYHIYRCLRIAREINMKCVGIGAKVAFYYWPSALIREFAAVFLTRKFLIWSVIGYLIVISPAIYMLLR